MTSEADFSVAIGAAARKLRVFVSSGDDLAALRQRVFELGRIFDSQLDQVGLAWTMYVDMWEDTPAQKVPSGHVNDLFVKRALDSDLTLVLLARRLGPGTKEEIDAVRAAERPDLAILWFRPDVGKVEPELKAFITEMEGEAFLNELGPCDSDDAWSAIVRVLLRLVLRAARQPEPS